MIRCLDDLRGPAFLTAGGSENSMSRHWWRQALFTPTPPGTDPAVLPV